MIGQKKAINMCNKCDLDVLVLVIVIVQVLVIGLVRGGEEVSSQCACSTGLHKLWNVLIS